MARRRSKRPRPELEAAATALAAVAATAPERAALADAAGRLRAIVGAVHARRSVVLRGVGVALSVVLFAGMGDAAPARKPSPKPAPKAAPAPARAAVHHAVAAPAPKDPAPWGSRLPPVSVTNQNTNARAALRLYSDHGSLELAALKSFMRVASSIADEPDAGATPVREPLDARLVQLVFRASYHFGAAPVVIVSATRKGAHGKHGKGEALDFKLDGVAASALAAFVRTYPRAGIGIYTHPKTQYVHVDVRDRSYHWIDGSPPGVTWREKLLADPNQEARDASYVGAMDLPEVARPAPPAN